MIPMAYVLAVAFTFSLHFSLAVGLVSTASPWNS
jgi:hypothetical protein